MTSTALLTLLRERGVISSLDAHVAGTLTELAGDPRDAVALALALASRHTREGHVCLDLAGAADRELRGPDGEPTGVCCPPLVEWLALLAATPLVADGEAPTPLVLDQRARLYLRRYWQHERRVAQLLLCRARPIERRIDKGVLRASLARMFGDPTPPSPDWQRVAAQLAVLNGLTIVVGGPGTGKTSTVVRVLALLAENAVALGERPPRALLVAPTGKAAARLADAIQGAKQALDCSVAARAAITEESSTIHRALGSLGDGRTHFRHDSQHPLRADVVVVDEASMVDLALMRRLLEAVPPAARLILLGDRNQLVSVEAGAVLGEICAGWREPCYSVALATRAQEAFGEVLPGERATLPAPLADTIVELRKSHRFREDSGIGALARALELGDPERVLSVLGQPGASGLRFVEQAPGAPVDDRFFSAVLGGYRHYLSEHDPLRALQAYDRFRVLCAHRRGRTGVEVLNARIQRSLAERGLIRQGARFYRGRPLMVTENDPQLGVFNGDIGLVLADPVLGARVHFRVAEGVRSIAPARLPAHESAFALSIHKSQGSEFDEVLLVLPDPGSPLLSRELVYTGVTRAKRRLTLFGTVGALRTAVERQIQRASGLRDVLWPDQ